MTSRRHRIDADARNDGESWVNIDPSSRRDNADASILCRLRWAGKGMSASFSLLAVVFKYCIVATPRIHALSDPSGGHWVLLEALSTVNVTDFGAIPNDGGDDSAAIQRAINRSGHRDTLF